MSAQKKRKNIFSSSGERLYTIIIIRLEHHKNKVTDPKEHPILFWEMKVMKNQQFLINRKN